MLHCIERVTIILVDQGTTKSHHLKIKLLNLNISLNIDLIFWAILYIITSMLNIGAELCQILEHLKYWIYVKYWSTSNIGSLSDFSLKV